MKIGLDGHYLTHGQPSGMGVLSQKMIEGLANVDNENEYTIYVLEDKPFIQKNNFYLKQMSSIHSISYLRYFLTFPVELYLKPVDIFHAIYTVPLWTSCRVILTAIETSIFTNPDEFPASRLFQSQVRTVYRRSIKRANRIITPTRIGKERLLSYFDLPEEIVEVIPFGFNESFLKRCDPNYIDGVRRKYNITGDYIISVGDLHPRKNLARLIDAFNWLKESRKIPHQLVLVGKNLWRADEIRSKASSCSAGDSMVFTGYVTLDELRALYQGATLFAFPSLDEGFGLPVHEAMASRVPVIVSNRGALPEVGGDAALVVDPLSVDDIGQTILKVLEKPSLQEELIKRGSEQIKGFFWSESCRKTLDLYKELYLM